LISLAGSRFSSLAVSTLVITSVSIGAKNSDD